MKNIITNEKKNTAGKKILTGLFFLASVFLAAAVLVGSIGRGDTLVLVIIAGLLMLVAGYFFLSAIFEGKEAEWSRLYEEMEKNSQDDSAEQMVNYMESTDRTQKAVFSVMKRREESTEEQIARLEAAIERMAEEQAANHKAMVRYNKENARQMAINERETLEHVMSILVKKMEEGKNKELEVLQELLEKGIAVAPAGVAEELPEELFAEEFEETPDFLKEFGIEPDSEIESIMAGLTEEVSEEEPIEEEFVPEIFIPETETVTEEQPEVDVSVDSLGAATGVDLSDPNAALSPEDIAKLFAAAGN